MTHVAHQSIISRSRPGPILVVTGDTTIAIRAGTRLTSPDGRENFLATDMALPLENPVIGADYGVTWDDAAGPIAVELGTASQMAPGFFAGFHFAPGGCAGARNGGSDAPAINPQSLWDLGFRPSCDPRGMAFVDMPGGGIWMDIYLLSAEHANGTSRHGVKIADGDALGSLNYHDAVSIMTGHGKRLPTYDEFRAATYGVTEKSSASRHPKHTGLDAQRTSRYGLMQAAGNLWIWGTDGDPDDPRPSFFGGSWLSGGDAGSRCACLVRWPGDSDGVFGARGACDHLRP